MVNSMLPVRRPDAWSGGVALVQQHRGAVQTQARQRAHVRPQWAHTCTESVRREQQKGTETEGDEESYSRSSLRAASRLLVRSAITLLVVNESGTCTAFWSAALCSTSSAYTLSSFRHVTHARATHEPRTTKVLVGLEEGVAGEAHVWDAVHKRVHGCARAALKVQLGSEAEERHEQRAAVNATAAHGLCKPLT